MIQPRWRTAAGAAILFLATFSAYVPALEAGWIWDDDQYVTHNPALRDTAGLVRIWTDPAALPQYYPLVHTTFWLERRLFGEGPRAFHAVNVALHAAAAFLAWRLLRRLGVPGAFLIASVFAVHPVHVESVAWVTERKNVLSGALYLAAMLACTCWLGLGTQPPSPRERRLYWCWGFTAFVGALLSKTVTCTLPVVVVLVCWWKHRAIRRNEWAALVPFVLAGGVLGLHTAWMEKHHVGARGADWTLSLAERVLVAGRAIWFYLGKLAWPAELTFVYPRWTLDSGAPWQWLYPTAAFLMALALLVTRGRVGRAPFTALAIFVVTLSPALGFFDVYPHRFSFVADHFQYLASLAALALVGAGLAIAARRVPAPAARGAATMLCLVLAALTAAQTRIYRDQETLWRDTVSKNPSAWIAWNNLGAYLMAEGRAGEAIEPLQAAVRLKTDYVEAYNNLGVALARAGRRTEAIAAYREAVRQDAGHVAARYNLGRTLAQHGDLRSAEVELAEVVRLAPHDARAQQDLGRARALQGRLAEAVPPLTAGLAATPTDPEAHRELGDVLFSLGQLDEAGQRYADALAIDPSSDGARRGLEAVKGRLSASPPADR